MTEQWRAEGKACGENGVRATHPTAGPDSDSPEPATAARQKGLSQLRILLSVLNSMAEGVVVADEAGELVLFNSAAEELLGVETLETALARWTKQLEVCSADSAPCPAEDFPLLRAIRGESVDHTELAARCQDDRLWLSMSARPLRGEKGVVGGGVAVFHDITNQKNTQRQLEKQATELLEANARLKASAHEHARLYQALVESQRQMRQSQKMEALGQLAAGMAHNFNNMLQGIMAHIQLAMIVQPERIPKHLREATACVERTAGLVDSLLRFSRKGVPSEHGPVDLAKQIHNVVGICRKTFDRRTEIAVFLTDTPPVLGDRSQLEQVLLNLCLNARDAVEEVSGREDFTPRIEIRAEVVASKSPTLGARHHNPGDRDSDTGTRVRIRISDNGTGMDSATAERVFEPFFTTKKVGTGTGLGLATVLGIVEEHRGTVTCESTLGRGSIFELCLPVISDPGEAEETTQGHGPTAGTETILMIEDEALVRKSSAEVLRMFGYQVVEGDNGRHGWELFQRYRDHGLALVLLDLSLPQGSGQEVLDRIRSIDTEIPVIIFTGFDVPPSESYQVSAVIRKPYSTIELARRIRRVLTKRPVPPKPAGRQA